MQQYLRLLRSIYRRGEDVETRNGTTRRLFACQIRFDLEDGFPAVTTKELDFKAVVAELILFIEGSRDDNRLKELIGRDKTIWTANANADYWAPKAQFDGDLGRIYGVQWRSWVGPDGEKIDQLKGVVNSIRQDPYGRRHVVTAWNPAELDKMSLPPCHMLFQFFVTKDGKLSVAMTQRSADMFLGVPFNIASYALLLSMVAQVTGLTPGEIVITFNDAHIYHSHFKAVREQTFSRSRKPFPLPRLWLNPDIKEIDDFTIEDIKLLEYKHHSRIKAVMAV